MKRELLTVLMTCCLLSSVATLNHALKKENLFDPEFVAQGVGQKAVRALQLILKNFSQDKKNQEETPTPASEEEENQPGGQPSMITNAITHEGGQAPNRNTIPSSRQRKEETFVIFR